MYLITCTFRTTTTAKTTTRKTTPTTTTTATTSRVLQDSYNGDGVKLSCPSFRWFNLFETLLIDPFS